MDNNYMEVLDSLKFRYVREKDLIYFVEYDLDSDGKHWFVVHYGYYLATYQSAYQDITTNYHIVSLGDITSCVVRHLEDGVIFLTRENAQKRADELNEIRGK